MAGAFSVTFLGTSSGGGPSESRNCSSLVCDVVRDGSLWMVDCAEGTIRQFAFQSRQNALKPSKVTKIFITHMHADHIMGIVPFLRSTLFPPPAGDSSKKPIVKQPRIEIYGPAGIRNFVRQIMKMTLTRTSDTYVVHELVTVEDTRTPCFVADDATNNVLDVEVMHCNETPGLDILCSPDGFWEGLTRARGAFGDVFVDAGPISHRDPCIGYIIREASGPQRKLVILGDTHDPSSIIPLCVSPSPSLLIHEATDAHIPKHVDYNQKRTPEVVLEKVLARGHSIPTMAGDFAKAVGAERLVLNHISPRFPAPRNSRDHRSSVMSEIERQATQAWGSGTSAMAAYDFMSVIIPATMTRTTAAGVIMASSQSHSRSTSGPSGEVTLELQHADLVEGFLYINNRSHSHNNKNKKRRL
ncbi:Ribonuclease Z [Hypsizygus marmoreus]|uniref:Ribonuclease Z n=1 Tax=Hypsizygus marmoreus TaxID=39966 RepID=A0A369JZM6_HYPMA|nr:Ribonuclease Z [Hypsizygus marmoreus]